MKVRAFLCFFLLFATFSLTAQDKHFTLYNMAPLRINPANTGAFEGTVRIGGIFRDQGFGISTVSGAMFRTPSVYADSPILMVGKRSWLGGGFMFYSDRAGRVAEITETASLLSAAFHHMLDKKGKNVLTLGVQGGNVARRVQVNSMQDLVLIDTEMIGSGSTGGGTGGQNNNNALDINVGMLFSSAVRDSDKLRLGFSLNHLTRPDYTVLGATGGGTPGPNPNPNPNPGNRKTAARPILTVLHGDYLAQLNDKWQLEPSFFIQNIAGSPLELVLQSWAGVKINPDKDLLLRFGLGYRVNDAGQILVGIDQGDLRVAASYDLTLSSLSDVNGGNGGFELSAYYIFKVYKTPPVETRVLCPQL